MQSRIDLQHDLKLNQRLEEDMKVKRSYTLRPVRERRYGRWLLAGALAAGIIGTASCVYLTHDDTPPSVPHLVDTEIAMPLYR